MKDTASSPASTGIPTLSHHLVSWHCNHEILTTRGDVVGIMMGLGIEHVPGMITVVSGIGKIDNDTQAE